MKVSELRDKSVSELNSELLSLLKEQFNLRLQKGLGQPPKVGLFKKVRRNIARVKTILKMKGSSV
ncbi:MAG: 50S ribosomal protein L29 [Gammaproteobacteria bacterium RIFCSPHIGHO2_12_FULL_41_20]|nr:MAG: 50S ribosomal protein L29 [Gammaproteobacteria bacterium RIFCSPHIGHO2_12_FULL_41_20]